VQRELTDCRSTRWAKVEWAQEALRYSNWNSQISLECFFLQSREEIDPLLAQQAENTQQISAFLQKIREQVESDKERELLDAVEEARWTYVNSFEQSLQRLMDEEVPAATKAAMVKATLPLLLNSHNAWNAFVQFQRAAEEFAGRTEEWEQKVADSSRAMARANQELATEVAKHERVEETLRESGRRTRLLLDSTTEAIYGVNLLGQCTFCNASSLRILGYKEPRDLLGKNMHALIHHSHPDGSPYPQSECRFFLAVRQGRGTQALEEVLWRADGSSFPAECYTHPVHQGGELVGSVVTFFDITERKKAEERFHKAFHASPEPITIATILDGRYLDINESFLRVTGHQREEVVGRTSLELGFWERPADRARLVEELTERGSVRDLEITFRTKSGEQRAGLDSAEIIEVAGQKCILTIFKDITQQKILEKQRKQAEEVLAQRAAELARSNAELEQFAYVASHDLQEPLRMVASYTQLLAKRYEDKLDADARDFIAYAVDGASRMQALIADLLNYSRVGTRGKPFQPVNCDAILERTLVALKLAMSEGGAVVTHDPLPTVMGDDVQLGQLFQNLLANAIKFRSQQPARIHVSAERDGNAWRFSVQDNGIGIAPEYSERIFMIFQRLHSKGEYPGTGIGLAICKKIVERHGGRIGVNSQPGSGAIFFFTIPDSNTGAQDERGEHEH